MKIYNVTGMSCAACSARVEKAVSKVPEVESCAVSLLTNSMGVEGAASSEDIIKAVVKAGYGASLKGGSSGGPGFQGGSAGFQGRAMDEYASNGSGATNCNPGTLSADSLEDHDTPVLKKRLIYSVGFLVVLMYFSMGHMMWNFPIPSWFDGNHVAMGLVQLILAGIVMVINQKFFISGFKGLINRSPNMDTLVALGATASYAWSIYALFAMTDAQVKGNMDAVMMYMDEFYFESAAMILTLITVGKMLEARSKGKTTDALKSLISLAPKTATIIKNGNEVTVPASQVRKNDIFIVRPGESIPVDGIVIEGESAINESALTGESIPVDKAAGDMVSAATINQSGFLKCQASRVGEDTTLSQIIKMVSDAAATKAPIAKIADKVSGVFVPVVITIAVITTIVWMITGADFAFALARGISVLVISCPCALGLATPVAIMVGSGLGAKNGILFKTAVSLEETGKVEIVALDKTGTITKGEPTVTDIMPAEGVTEHGLMILAASLESKSEHPLAKAIMQEANARNIETLNVEKFTALPGNGLSGEIEGSIATGGSLKFIREKIQLSDEVLAECGKLADEGKTPLLFTIGEQFVGLIAVADTMKEDSPEAIKELQSMGIKVVMLTGDNEKTANAIGREAGVDQVIAGVLPDGKEAVIRELKEQGKVAMVGDGINDAPALTRADMGIAIGAGADVAVDAADVVLMKNSLMDVPAAIRLSRGTLRNIRQNLFWAFIYNVIGIPLAAGCYVHLGLTLNPMFAAAAMSLSSFCVVTNALRLNFCKLYGNNKVHSAEAKAEEGLEAESVEAPAEETVAAPAEEQSIEKTIKIVGMMCEHCEAFVSEALMDIEGVESAEASHEAGIAKVKLLGEVDDEKLKAAVEGEGYEVISIE